MERWIVTTWPDAAMTLLSVVVIYAAIIGYTRIVGLRSFSKMSASDFAMTVAVGSLFGSAISSPSPPIFLALTAFAGLFAGQWFLAVVRQRFRWTRFIDNTPLLLMTGPEMIEANLRAAHITREDVVAKLREANVLNFNQVQAVVFETTGDISVLHSGSGNGNLSDDLMLGVRTALRN